MFFPGPVESLVQRRLAPKEHIDPKRQRKFESVTTTRRDKHIDPWKVEGTRGEWRHFGGRGPPVFRVEGGCERTTVDSCLDGRVTVEPDESPCCKETGDHTGSYDHGVRPPRDSYEVVGLERPCHRSPPERNPSPVSGHATRPCFPSQVRLTPSPFEPPLRRPSPP